MLTAAELIDRACFIAKGAGFRTQALQYLNVILNDLCETTRLARARGVFHFNFNPGLASLFGSGPYPLPLDYLRTSDTSGETGTGRSTFFLYPSPAFPAGVPMYLTPIDLAEFDMFPQMPASGFPTMWATDMGAPLTERIVLSTTAALTANSTTATPAVLTGLVAGLAMAGEGITPGTTIAAVASPDITLSLPATATMSAASVFFGIAPVGYAYPPPAGAYPMTIRYQRQMPELFDTSKVPWFPNEGYLLDKLASRIMQETGDTREMQYRASADQALDRYLKLSDDKTNRAQNVQLDLRRFGGAAQYQRLKNTKIQGW